MTLELYNLIWFVTENVGGKNETLKRCTINDDMTYAKIKDVEMFSFQSFFKAY